MQEPVLGQFEFRSGKPGLPDGEGHCQAYVFVMHVAEELECWPEGSERHRTWVGISLARACSACTPETRHVTCVRAAHTRAFVRDGFFYTRTLARIAPLPACTPHAVLGARRHPALPARLDA